MTTKVQKFEAAIKDELREAHVQGLKYLDINAGDLHRRLGGYPSPSHVMASCCLALRSVMSDEDAILRQPPKGNGASLTIRFHLPRTDDATGKRIKIEDLKVGKTYSRNELAKMWGYESYNAIGRGVVTPANESSVVLFVTEENQEALPQYDNWFDGETLWMDGERGHGSDQRLLHSLDDDDEVLLFYRDTDHSDFTFKSRVFLVSGFIQDESPSRFVFTTNEGLCTVEDPVSDDDAGQENDPEGKSKERLQIVYERSPKNRKRALEIHGCKCAACGFEFNSFYGEDLADSYIQIHHKESITKIDGRVVDPEKDLVPLCANCHCMVHRKKGEIMPVEDLRSLLEKLGSI